MHACPYCSPAVRLKECHSQNDCAVSTKCRSCPCRATGRTCTSTSVRWVMLRFRFRDQRRFGYYARTRKAFALTGNFTKIVCMLCVVAPCRQVNEHLRGCVSLNDIKALSQLASGVPPDLFFLILPWIAHRGCRLPSDQARRGFLRKSDWSPSTLLWRSDLQNKAELIRKFATEGMEKCCLPKIHEQYSP